MTTPRWLLVVVVVGATGIAVGRYTARSPDVALHEAASETIAEQTTQEAAATVEATTAATEATAATVTQASERVVVRRVVEYRDGPVARETDEVEAESSRLAMELQASRKEASTLRAELAEARASVRTEAREVERRVEVHSPLPDWRVGGLVGLSLRGGPEPAFGAEVQRRILGPVYLQAWGLNTGAAGVGVGLEIP